MPARAWALKQHGFTEAQIAKMLGLTETLAGDYARDGERIERHTKRGFSILEG